MPPTTSAEASHVLHWLPCRTQTLLIASGEDRLLPSLTEAVRLQSLLPSAQRVVLPDSGHTALLEVRLPLALSHALLQAASHSDWFQPSWGGLLRIHPSMHGSCPLRSRFLLVAVFPSLRCMLIHHLKGWAPSVCCSCPLLWRRRTFI